MKLSVALRYLRANKQAKLAEVGAAIGLTAEEYFLIEKGRLIPDSYMRDDLGRFYGLVNGRIFDNCTIT